MGVPSSNYDPVLARALDRAAARRGARRWNPVDPTTRAVEVLAKLMAVAQQADPALAAWMERNRPALVGVIEAKVRAKTPAVVDSPPTTAVPSPRAVKVAAEEVPMSAPAFEFAVPAMAWAAIQPTPGQIIKRLTKDGEAHVRIRARIADAEAIKAAAHAYREGPFAQQQAALQGDNYDPDAWGRLMATSWWGIDDTVDSAVKRAERKSGVVDPAADAEILRKLRSGADQSWAKRGRGLELLGLTGVPVKKGRKVLGFEVEGLGTWGGEEPSYRDQDAARAWREAQKAVRDTLSDLASDALGVDRVIRDTDGRPQRARDYRTDLSIRTCPVCFRDIKATDGTMADHGFTISGRGYSGFGGIRRGSCQGTGERPFEVSPEATEAYLEGLLAFSRGQVEAAQRIQDTIDRRERTSIYDTPDGAEPYRGTAERIEVGPEDRRWQRVLDQRLRNIQQSLKQLWSGKFDSIPWLRMAIRTWQPWPPSKPAIGAPTHEPIPADFAGKPAVIGGPPPTPIMTASPELVQKHRETVSAISDILAEASERASQVVLLDPKGNEVTFARSGISAHWTKAPAATASTGWTALSDAQDVTGRWSIQLQAKKEGSGWTVRATRGGAEGIGAGTTREEAAWSALLDAEERQAETAAMVEQAAQRPLDQAVAQLGLTGKPWFRDVTQANAVLRTVQEIAPEELEDIIGYLDATAEGDRDRDVIARAAAGLLPAPEVEVETVTRLVLTDDPEQAVSVDEALGWLYEQASALAALPPPSPEYPDDMGFAAQTNNAMRAWLAQVESAGLDGVPMEHHAAAIELMRIHAGQQGSEGGQIGRASWEAAYRAITKAAGEKVDVARTRTDFGKTKALTAFKPGWTLEKGETKDGRTWERLDRAGRMPAGSVRFELNTRSISNRGLAAAGFIKNVDYAYQKDSMGEWGLVIAPHALERFADFLDGLGIKAMTDIIEATRMLAEVPVEAEEPEEEPEEARSWTDDLDIHSGSSPSQGGRYALHWAWDESDPETVYMAMPRSIWDALARGGARRGSARMPAFARSPGASEGYWASFRAADLPTLHLAIAEIRDPRDRDRAAALRALVPRWIAAAHTAAAEERFEGIDPHKGQIGRFRWEWDPARRKEVRLIWGSKSTAFLINDHFTNASAFDRSTDPPSFWAIYRSEDAMAMADLLDRNQQPRLAAVLRALAPHWTKTEELPPEVAEARKKKAKSLMRRFRHMMHPAVAEAEAERAMGEVMGLLATIRPGADRVDTGPYGQWWIESGRIAVQVPYEFRAWKEGIPGAKNRPHKKEYDKRRDEQIVTEWKTLVDLKHAPRVARALDRVGNVPLAMSIRLALLTDAVDGETCYELEEIAASPSLGDIADPRVRRAVEEIAIRIPRLHPQGYEPYPYQLVGVAFAELAGGRAIIGDDMGLGKTLQAISWLLLNPAERTPALVVAPAGVKFNWAKEITEWSGGVWSVEHQRVVKPGRLRPILYRTSDRDGKGTDLSRMGPGDVVVTTWTGLQLRGESLQASGFQTVIFDESHYAKNITAKRTQEAGALAKLVPYVLLLSGTAMENRPKELWHQLHMVDPDSYPSQKDYNERYASAKKRIVKLPNGQIRTFTDDRGHSNLDELRDLLRCVMVRRLKSEVLSDLPPKTRTYLWVPLPKDANRAYREAERQLVAWACAAFQRRALLWAAKQVRENSKRNDEGVYTVSTDMLKSVVEAANELAPDAEMTRMAMVEMGHLLRIVAQAKIAQAIAWTLDYIESGNPLVIFVKHKAVREALEQALTKAKVSWVAVHGGHDAKKKAQAVHAFQSGKVQVLIATQALREGATLTRAQDMLFVERWWVPSREVQAEDRIYRIGQKNAVNINYLMAIDTIDEHIADLVDKKREVIARVMRDQEVAERVKHDVPAEQAEAEEAGLSTAFLAKVMAELKRGGECGITVPMLRTFLQTGEPPRANPLDNVWGRW